MTPLAQRILRDSMLPMIQRKFQRNGCKQRRIIGDLLNAQVFELTQVFELIPPLGLKMLSSDSIRLDKLHETQYAFLPAPVTWMEYYLPLPKQRLGWLVRETGDNMALVMICLGQDNYMGIIAESVILLRGHQELGRLTGARVMPLEGLVPDDQHANNLALDTYPMLALINSPKIIGRRQHMPHVGLERQLARARGMVGRYPLQAWTEIILEVTVPRIDDELHEAHLTGKKALHFCRAHLRVRMGQLEFVKSHWRGDPAIGIKRSRYILRKGQVSHSL